MLFSQEKGEIGFFGGVSYYQGDLNQTKLFYSPSKAYGIIYRYNFNPRFVLRADAIFATLKGNDQDFSSLYQKERNYSFSTNITTIAFQTEFNFLPYLRKSKYQYFSPYLIAGFTFLIAPNPKSSFDFSLPFGFGFKYALSEKITVGLEWTYSKTFSDYLDQIPDDKPDITQLPLSKQKNNSFNKDWYSYAGITLSFTLLQETGKCPAYK